MPDSKTQMSQADASRIQSSNAKSGGDMSSGGFAARAQSAAAHNANAGGQQAGSGGQQGNSGNNAGKK
ncbi:hypothetical protein N0V93_004065 [Gnomoniopsis smithogilvyi]|uniref:SMP domain-containing protein n=1 Tax=Gnomoniopsis smithogilvyi TaxID=1191159 RepID=A0A9W8YXV0_9PEZI|nr:hypothetical protein N0V93_004065 [Gnomoniopsis smithogilvyi]